MDHRYIEDNNLIERYVLGRLPTEEQVRFEEHFADCDECLAQLELADDFDMALRTAVAEDAQQAASVGFVAILTQWFRGPRGAMILGALALLMALPSAWLFSQNRRLTSHLEELQRPQTGVPTLLLTLPRGNPTAEKPAFAIPANQSWWMLAIEANAADIVSYKAALKDTQGRVVWSEEDLKANLWSVLQLTFPTDFLSEGDYVLELEGNDVAGRSEPMGHYPFSLATPLP